MANGKKKGKGKGKKKMSEGKAKQFWVCNDCSLSFELEKQLLKHISAHKDKDDEKAEARRAEFESTRQAYNQARKNPQHLPKAKKQQQVQKAHACDCWTKKFKTSAGLKQHKGRIHKDKKA